MDKCLVCGGVVVCCCGAAGLFEAVLFFLGIPLLLSAFVEDPQVPHEQVITSATETQNDSNTEIQNDDNSLSQQSNDVKFSASTERSSFGDPETDAFFEPESISDTRFDSFSTESADFRIWTDTRGRMIKAEFLKLNNTGKIKLRSVDGRTKWASLRNLSRADQEFVQTIKGPRR